MHSLLPSFLVVVVVLWAAAGGRPLGAAVLLGLLQELVQTERILLKLNWPFTPLPMICTWELLVWNKPNLGHEKEENYCGVQHVYSFTNWSEELRESKFSVEDLFCLFISFFRYPQRKKEDKLLNEKLTARFSSWKFQELIQKHQRTTLNLCSDISWGQTFSFTCFVQWWNTAASQTFLEDNDKPVTKHTGQAMLC